MNGERRYRVTQVRRKVAIIIRCPDSRFIGANRGFIQEELKLQPDHYVSLKRAGAAISIARASEFPEDFGSIMGEITMFLKMHPGELSHIILINHDDCKRYCAANLANHGRSDLTRAAKTLQSIFHGIQVGAYFAKFTNANKKEIIYRTVHETHPRKSLRRP